MRLTPQRATIIDNLRAYGPMSDDDMLTRTGGVKRNFKSVVRGLIKEGCVTRKDGELRLLPAGYMAVGSFPARSDR